MTREEEIQATMILFRCSRFHAEELVAIEHGESKGDCVAVDEDGNEYTYDEYLRLRNKKPAA